ncbi:hypothetical protein [Novosphingobium sp. ZW T3_23]|uniref:hypothetical protein n=1 Tax=Novosphingobium sp. ZW T3_23 TaxID=3378084 RepID=UPI0038525F30
MTEITVTQEDREAAARLIESRKELYSTPEYLDDVRLGECGVDFAKAFARHRHEARKAALEEAIIAAHGAIFDLALGDTGNGRSVSPAQYSEAVIDAIRSAVGGEG